MPIDQKPAATDTKPVPDPGIVARSITTDPPRVEESAGPLSGPTATERLAELEKKIFPADAPRKNGQIERGIGSLYNRLPPHQLAHHRALEHLIKAETHLDHANAAVSEAQVKRDEAAKKVDEAAQAADEAEQADAAA